MTSSPQQPQHRLAMRPTIVGVRASGHVHIMHKDGDIEGFSQGCGTPVIELAQSAGLAISPIHQRQYEVCTKLSHV